METPERRDAELRRVNQVDLAPILGNDSNLIYYLISKTVSHCAKCRGQPYVFPSLIHNLAVSSPVLSAGPLR